MPEPKPTTEPVWLRVVLIATAAAFVGLVVLLPLVLVFAGALADGWRACVASWAEPDARSAITLTVVAAGTAVGINTVCGIAAAWGLAHARFPGRALVLALIDLPFAVSPVVAGLLFVLLLGRGGWGAPLLRWLHWQVLFATPGIAIATTFITLPFIVRELVPAMRALGSDTIEAALLLGAGGWRTLWQVVLPAVRWSLAQGVLLCTARALGEFGAVSVVSGRIRGATCTLPLHIQNLYEDDRLAAAFACAAALCLIACTAVLVRRGIASHLQHRLTAAQDTP